MDQIPPIHPRRRRHLGLGAADDADDGAENDGSDRSGAFARVEVLGAKVRDELPVDRGESGGKARDYPDEYEAPPSCS